MTTRTQIETQITQVKKRVNTEATKRKKQLLALRAKAAEAALHWVMSHQSQLDAFRASVKGTPVAKALDSLLSALRDAAGAKAKKRPAAKKKVAAKKPVAKKAAKTRKR